MCGRFSTTSTRLSSWLATRSAIVRPKNPEPTTKRSKRVVIGCLGYPTARPQPAWQRRSAGVFCAPRSPTAWDTSVTAHDRVHFGDEGRDWLTIGSRHSSHTNNVSTIDHVPEVALFKAPCAC